MSRARIRPLLAATAIAAVFAYGLLGHGLPKMNVGEDGMGGAAAGLCLLLATVVLSAGPVRRDTLHANAATDAVPSYAAPPPNPALDGRARASPTTLQRFRN